MEHMTVHVLGLAVAVETVEMRVHADRFVHAALAQSSAMAVMVSRLVLHQRRQLDVRPSAHRRMTRVGSVARHRWRMIGRMRRVHVDRSFPAELSVYRYR